MADTQEGLTTADIAAGQPVDEMPDDTDSTLLSRDDAQQFDDQWQKVQVGFVDHPREAVEQADKLVADLMQRLATEFSETRAGLERQWESSDDVSTEDLRVAMTRYRTFFERLLAA
jgi:hypothetical protein